LFLALALQPVAMDVDASGLSVLEKQALVDRARAEIGETVEAPGLAACADDACRADVLRASSARAGAVVRIVKVLQVVRVDLATVDADGAIVGRSTRSMDLEAAAKGPLFDANALAFIAPPSEPAAPTSATALTSAPTTTTTTTTDPETPPANGGPATPPTKTTAKQPEDAAPSTRTIAIGVAVGSGVLAFAALAVAGNEAATANSPTSLGGDK
jgi:hypothetical protein